MYGAQIGDLLVIGGACAYCSAMPAKNYNSIPEAPEVLIANDGSPVLIRSRQTAQCSVENRKYDVILSVSEESHEPEKSLL